MACIIQGRSTLLFTSIGLYIRFLQQQPYDFRAPELCGDMKRGAPELRRQVDFNGRPCQQQIDNCGMALLRSEEQGCGPNPLSQVDINTG